MRRPYSGLSKRDRELYAQDMAARAAELAPYLDAAEQKPRAITDSDVARASSADRTPELQQLIPAGAGASGSNPGRGGTGETSPGTAGAIPTAGAKRRHKWNGGDTCVVCGLRREGAGYGPYGAMQYYRADSRFPELFAGPCR